jgi:hypothetical protein
MQLPPHSSPMLVPVPGFDLDVSAKCHFIHAGVITVSGDPRWIGMAAHSKARLRAVLTYDIEVSGE